jgi:hypothetical protein
MALRGGRRYSQRRACALVGLQPKTYRYALRRPDDVPIRQRLIVRKRGGRKRALGTRAPMALPQGLNQRWSLDFMSDARACGSSANGGKRAVDAPRRLHQDLRIAA